MSIGIYQVLFLVSLVLSGIYMFFWHKHYDVHITLVFVLVPVVNLGSMLLTGAASQEMALGAMKISYLGGCFLQMILMLAIFSLCKIHVSRWVRILFLLVSSVVYLSVLTIGREPWFYRGVRFQPLGETGVLIREYGPMHTVFYFMVIGYFLLSFGVILYSLLRKNQISRKILGLLLLPEVVCLLCFFGGKQLLPGKELTPYGFVFAQLVYLLISWRISLYDVTDTVVDSMVQSGDIGFITFDTRYNYLGSNETARRILPGLNDLTVDLSLKRSKPVRDLLLPWLQGYRVNPTHPEDNRHMKQLGDRYYVFEVDTLADRLLLHGYRITIRDDTLVQLYIHSMEDQNEILDRQVAEKTQHIREMHNNLIKSMAVMVESRDNSTGGHIVRTSDCVRILLDACDGLEEMPKGYDLTGEFRGRLIKAAPMHDLGKIAVDDAILRKPGRFEPWEYEQMKAHAPEGARIVHKILRGTDDHEFHILAENVAHYHHERWDGKGYPDGLKGEEIPPEARIMAIADVYDALVSKRVYKEKMSFEKADAIMMEGMGTQFDPALKPVYVAARPMLEDYYRVLEEAEEQNATA